MKKVNFFKVMSACMAFAAVTFTSCSEEDMTIATPDDIVIPEMPESPVIPASASVAVSVYDVDAEKLLGVTSVDATASIGATMEVKCPEYEGYIVVSAVNVEIPALQDGQSVVVPVVFYVASKTSASAEIIRQIQENEGTKIEDLVLIDAKDTKKTYLNDVANDHGNVEIIKTCGGEKYDIFKGMEYLGEGKAPESKALITENGVATGYEFVESVLKSMKENKWAIWKWEFPTFWINPYHETETTVEQAGEKKVYEIKFNGSTFYAEFKVAGAAKWTMAPHTVNSKYTDEWAHTHTHGKIGHDWFDHSHGAANINAGGGIVEGE